MTSFLKSGKNWNLISYHSRPLSSACLISPLCSPGAGWNAAWWGCRSPERRWCFFWPCTRLQPRRGLPCSSCRTWRFPCTRGRSCRRQPWRPAGAESKRGCLCLVTEKEHTVWVKKDVWDMRAWPFAFNNMLLQMHVAMDPANLWYHYLTSCSLQEFFPSKMMCQLSAELQIPTKLQALS